MRNFTYILSGSVLSQIIVVALSPVLSRVYSPNDFGQFATIVVWSYILSSFFAFRLDYAILGEVVADNKNKLIKQAKKFLYMNSLILIVLVCMLYFSNIISYEYLLLPIMVFFSALYSIYYNYNLTFQDQKYNFIGRLTQGGGGVIAQLILGFCFSNMLGLIIGQSLGFFLALFFLKKENKQKVIKKLNIRNYKNFIIYDSLNAFFKVISNHISLLLFSLFFGFADVGAYYMASRVLMLPIATISTTISQFLCAKYIKWKTDNTLQDKLIFITKFIFTSSILLAILLDDIVYDLFIFVLGQNWEEAAKVASISIYWLTLRFIFECISSLMSIAGYQKRILVFQIGLNLTNCIIIVVGAYYKADFITIIEALNIALFLLYFIGIFLFVVTFIKSSLLDVFLNSILVTFLLILSLYLNELYNIFVLIILVYYLIKDKDKIRASLNDD